MIQPPWSNPELLVRGEKFNVYRVDVPSGPDGAGCAGDGGAGEAGGERGRRLRRDVVDHPGAVVILPLLEDGRVLLTRNHRWAIGQTILELPAGTLEPPPETPASCAGRELLEETGYEAAQLRPLLAFYSAPGFCTELLHGFVATGLTWRGQQLEPGERIEPVAMTWPRVLAAIAAGSIVDAKTLTVLLYYHSLHAKADAPA